MMDELMKFLQEEFSKIHQKMDQRFEKVDSEMAAIKSRLDDVERVVRESAQDILENQVEAVDQHRLHAAKITLLEAGQLKLTSTVLDHGRRLEKLEKSIDGK